MTTIFGAVFISFWLTFLITIPVIQLAKKYGLVDDRLKRKHPAHTHYGIIPRGGGISIYLGILITTLFFIYLNHIIFGILIGGFLIAIMGILDDYFDLSPYSRFIFNIIIAGIVISFGLGIPYISNPFGGIIKLDNIVMTIHFFGKHKFLLISNLAAIIWLVTLMNFVNWSKGVDGQMPGFVFITALFLGILSFRSPAHNISQQSVILLAFITAGCFAGFLPFNFYPQKIMPGYGGGALAGFFLGVLSILSFGKFGTLILILSIPFIDAIYVILNRLKNFKSPFRADASHFHHRLLEIGWGRRRITFFYWLVSFLFGTTSLFLYGNQKIFALMGISISLAVFILIINRIKETHAKI